MNNILIILLIIVIIFAFIGCIYNINKRISGQRPNYGLYEEVAIQHPRI